MYCTGGVRCERASAFLKSKGINIPLENITGLANSTGEAKAAWIAQKFGEESSELIIDFLKGSKKRTIEEAVDVIYHLLIM